MSDDVTCPQCGEEQTTIGRYEVTAPNGRLLFWAYYFTCCGEPVESWGYSDVWAQEKMDAQAKGGTQ